MAPPDPLPSVAETRLKPCAILGCPLGEAAAPARPSLLPRQLEILSLTAAGMNNKQVARELGLAIGTVELHLHCARRRNACKTTAELVAVADRAGLV